MKHVLMFLFVFLSVSVLFVQEAQSKKVGKSEVLVKIRNLFPYPHVFKVKGKKYEVSGLGSVYIKVKEKDAFVTFTRREVHIDNHAKHVKKAKIALPDKEYRIPLIHQIEADTMRARINRGVLSHMDSIAVGTSLVGGIQNTFSDSIFVQIEGISGTYRLASGGTLSPFVSYPPIVKVFVKFKTGDNKCTVLQFVHLISDISSNLFLNRQSVGFRIIIGHDRFKESGYVEGIYWR